MCACIFVCQWTWKPEVDVRCPQLLSIFLRLYICVGACAYECWWPRRPEEDTLDLETQAFVTCPMWVVWVELSSSTRAVPLSAARLSSVPFLILLTVSQLSLELHGLARLARQPDPGIFLFLLPTYAGIFAPGFLCGCWRLNLGPLCKHITSPDHNVFTSYSHLKEGKAFLEIGFKDLRS